MISFHQIYQQYVDQIYRFAFCLCGDEMEANDLTSETFVRLWTHLGSVQTETVKGYLFSITNNLFLQSRRSAHRRQEMPNNLPDLTPGPERMVQGKHSLATVIAAMKLLPEIDRAALVLRAYEHLSYREIAQCLNTSVSAARVKVHRSRLKLLEILEKENPTHAN